MYTHVSRGNVFTCTSVRAAILKNLKHQHQQVFLGELGLDFALVVTAHMHYFGNSLV